MAVETVIYGSYRDGDGGSYSLSVTQDVTQSRITVQAVTVDNSQRNYDTHWSLDVNAKHFEGVVLAHQSQTWSGLSERIDNRDIQWSIG